jgi:hypothetical protein
VSPAPESDARVESRSGTAVRRFPNRTDITPRDGGRVDGGAVLSDRSATGRAIERRDIGRSVERNGVGSAGRVDSRSYSNDGRYSGRVAIPRVGPAPQRRDGRYAYGGRTYVDGGRYYTYAPRYYYSPRYYSYRPSSFYRPSYLTAFSFGFGPRGRGFFYFDSFYDSYVFYPRTIVRYGDYGRYGYATGTLRLDVEPRDAQVYIDGAYAGLVDDFDGVFQSLRLEAGEYQVEIVLPGFETLAFDVRIFPGEKTTYRGDLIPERP